MVGSTSDVSRLLRLVIFILWLNCYLTISFQKGELRALKTKPHNRINSIHMQQISVANIRILDIIKLIT